MLLGTIQMAMRGQIFQAGWPENLLGTIRYGCDRPNIPGWQPKESAMDNTLLLW